MHTHSTRQRHVVLSRNEAQDPRAAAALTATVAERELEWFFTLAESDMGSRSNFLDMLLISRHREDGEDATLRRVDACTAYRTIKARLQQLEAEQPGHAGVLQAAYAPRPWAMAVRRFFGRAAGVAVRLRAVEGWGMTDDARKLDIIEQAASEALRLTLRENGPPELSDLRAQASARYAEAFRRYVRVRGDGPSAVAHLEERR